MRLCVADEPARRHLGTLPPDVELVLFPESGLPDAELAGIELLALTWERPAMLEALARMPALRVVQSLSAGIDWVLPHVPDRVVLCDAAGVHDVPVAEWVLAAILAELKRLPEARDAQRAGRWDKPAVQELAGRTVLVVGHGSIGRAVERRLAPFDVEVVGVARHRRPGVHAIDELPELLGEADVVVLLVPLTPATERLVDAAFLERMRAGALLVNAARGAVVDTGALRDALHTGHVRAALDVTDPEPLPPGDPLWQAPGALITPHVAGDTPRFRERAYRLVRAQLDRYRAGEPLVNVVREGY